MTSKRLILAIYFIINIIFLNNGFANTETLAKQGMVVSEHKLATEAGVAILKAGGNAIDAAVAVGYALAVVNPCCGNIGGGGFMTLHLADGKNIFINFREKAPLAATSTMFINQEGQLLEEHAVKGYLAVAVPGTVLGLDTVLKKYGTLSREKVMRPAILLAREGFTVTPYMAKQLQPFTKDFSQDEPTAAIFLKQGKALQAGDQLIQQDLAKSLTLIANQGPNVFYRGSIAKDIIAASKQHGGILTLTDFANYTIEESPPIYCDYRSYQLISAAPPSSGGVTICEILQILEYFPEVKSGFREIQAVQPILEAMRYSFIDRNMKLGDPAFVKNPIQELLSKEYAYTLSQKIKMPSAKRDYDPVFVRELTDTTHYSVMDKWGNAVSVTYTLNGFFGAHVIAPHTGFFLNNEMDDFAIQPGVANKFGLVQYDTNAIQPGKRPLSSMAPTIVLKDGKVVMVIGSPGGPRIITAVLLTLINKIDRGMSLQQAIDAPRFHFQASPDIIDMEPRAFSFLTRLKLELSAYHLYPQTTWAAVEAIQVNPDTHELIGANDYRRPDGAAIGY